MSGIHRFLTRREHSNRYRKQHKDDSSILSKPLFRGFFSSAPTTEEDKMDAPRKIKALERRLEQLGITGINRDHISYALKSDHAQGNVDRAFDLLLLLEDSIEGIIRGFTARTKLLGAENREGVTCYLDALLFAMFARLDCFEAMLYKEYDDEPRRKLAILLRLWVNLLRSGKLITPDITKHLQDALAECGWEDAANLRQQDTSEAFTFITEKLELPLLTLKMDIYHTGREDMNGDHKFVNERLLEVAIPEPVDGQTVTLEDCLESYFNNKIEVKRYLQRRNTVSSTMSAQSMDSTAKGFSSHVEAVELSSSAPSTPSSPKPEETTPVSSMTDVNESTTRPDNARRSSIVNHRFIPASESANENDNSGASTPRVRQGSIRKEVMMPAWQFFSLIPWYTDSTPTNDAQVAAHFSTKRPILGMCLKRYSVLPSGRAVRLDTFVDIPTEIGLPHFIQDDNMEEDGPIYGNFKLSLQAIVCHRGNSVESGHYISMVRGTKADAPPDDLEGVVEDPSRYWLRFDDLAEEKITLIDIEEALATESPYLLFYQILPIHEDAADANVQSNTTSSDMSEDTEDLDAARINRKFNTLSVGSSDNGLTSECMSGRPSFEITGADNDGDSETPTGRKPSVAFSGSTDPFTSSGNLNVVTPTSPKLLAKDDDGGRFSFSRHGSRATRSNASSRAGSQNSESRISATFSRFTGRLSRDKPPSDEFFTEDEGEDGGRAESELASSNGDKSTSTSDDGREKSSRGRTKHREKKGKAKAKPKEKKDLERECTLM